MTKITKALASDLMKMAHEDPLGTLRTCQAHLSEAHEDLKRIEEILVIVGYACAYEIERDWEKWKEFIKDSFWSPKTKKPRRDKDVNKKLLLSMKYVFGLIGRGDKTAWYYYATLRSYFNSGVAPKDLAARIKSDGGMAKLYRQALEERREARRLEEERRERELAEGDYDLGPETPDEDEDLKLLSDSDDDEYQGLLDSGKDAEQEPSKGSISRTVSGGSSPPTKAKSSIEFEYGSEAERELLAVPAGQRVLARLERFEGGSASPRFWVRLEPASVRAKRRKLHRERQARIAERQARRIERQPQRTWSTFDPRKG